MRASRFKIRLAKNSPTPYRYILRFSSVWISAVVHIIYMMSDNVHRCAVCQTPAMQLCAGCKSVYYCNREHQKKHWKDGHKNHCAAYKIAPTNGRQQLFAARDIKQNEVILLEKPVILGPHDISYATCLGCNRRIQDSPEHVHRCKACNWPLCGLKCQDAPLHKEECKLMAAKGFKANFEYSDKVKQEDYNIIGPLRCLILKSTAKNKFDTLIALLAQSDLVAPDTKLEKLKTTVVPFIQNILKLDCTESEILQVCTMFEINTIDIEKEDGDINVKGLYPMAALLKHDCIPNTKFSIQGDQFQLVLIATVPIAKGDVISTSYSEVLWGTLERRAHLKLGRYIDCECKRCSDKTELGTHLGAIFCARCKKTNEESCPKMLSTDPLNSGAIWKCEKCDHTIRGRQMVWGNDAIKSDMNRLGKNPLNLEKFLNKYKETLHTKNYHALVAKYALSQIYGNVKGYLLNDLTDEILERKIDICHELLEVVDELAPGYSTIRGSLLYDLQSAMVVQSKRELNNGKITKPACQETLTECIVILKEASEILSSEPEMKEFLTEKLQHLVKELDI